MSEYQYYEWLAIDQALDSAGLREVQRLSSHMDHVTPTSAVVTYSYGDFKHDPIKVLVRHFDAFLYTSNWGTRTLAFRFPKDTPTLANLSEYLMTDSVELEKHGKYQVLSFHIDYENGSWIDEYEDDSDGTLSTLAGVRRQIALGDYRALYLMWLAALQRESGSETNEEYDDAYDGELPDEPPIPPGLASLDASLTAFRDFFGIDPHLVTAAAQDSPAVTDISRADVKAAIAKLSRATCDGLLLRLYEEEPQLGVKLRQQLFGAPSPSKKKARQTPGRNAIELLETAKRITEQAKQREKARVHAARIKALEKLATRADEAWREVVELLDRKTAAGYSGAVNLLVDLRDMAQHKGTSQAFERQLTQIRAKYGKSRVFQTRLAKAGLV
jgi:hypothetical protein